MINVSKKEIPNSLRKKLDAKRHNAEYINYTLDPEYFKWDSMCKRCHGKGISGLNKLSGAVVYCKCVQIIKIAKREDLEKKSDITT